MAYVAYLSQCDNTNNNNIINIIGVILFMDSLRHVLVPSVYSFTYSSHVSYIVLTTVNVY